MNSVHTERDAPEAARREGGEPGSQYTAPNGNNDILVPTVNSYLLAGHLPDAELIIYPDANHGFLFQYPHEFALEVNRFLTAAKAGPPRDQGQ